MPELERKDYQEGPAEHRYMQLEPYRFPFLDRARECSELTIPSLLPPAGWDGSQKLYKPYQSVGARGVRNLAAKLLLVLFPPNTPIHRFKMDEALVEEMKAGSPDFKTEVEKTLQLFERIVTDSIESRMLRPAATEMLNHLIVAGNVLVFYPPLGQTSMRVFHLDRYVVKRDPMGNVLEIVTKEDVSPKALPEDVREVLMDRYQTDLGDDKTHAIYTYIYLDGNRWHHFQEICGIKIPGTEGEYPLDKSPWMPLRFSRIDGEDYGRGYVEELLGDLQSLEGLSQSIVDGAAMAARMLGFVSPNGTTRLQALRSARNGDFVQGNAADVTFLQTEKFHDFRTAFEQAQVIERRLAMAFLMNTAIQRSGERVTAEEIRFLAQELETGLGGVYSVLSQDFQLPLIMRETYQLEQAKKLPKLPKGAVRPIIVTGMEALGRGHDLNKLDLFLSGAQQTIGPDAVAQYLRVDTYLKRRATALGIDTEDLVRTPEEVNAAQQQAMLQQTVEKLGPNVINAMSQHAQAQPPQEGA